MQRDTEEFIELLTGAQSAVFGYIVSLCHDHALAKDILQETSLRALRGERAASRVSTGVGE